MVRAGVEGRASYASATYEDALRALNGLQSNASVISDRVKNPNSKDRLDNVKKYLERSGMSLNELDNLSVIHVAGTKGKGSTCVFAESLLRAHGVRTGMFTSPHLISVRERLQINGKPIDEDKFAKKFFDLYKKLKNNGDDEEDMPPYFTFLTIMMFHLFVDSPIDVAIIEVGIGGEYDCTNIIRKPICVGITSLGLDHTLLLGNTISEIAHQKSGIFKFGSPAFSSPQPAQASIVLEARAREKGCILNFAPPLESYHWKNNVIPNLGIAGEFQSCNASLAISMASTWLRKKFDGREQFSLDRASRALSLCKWPGRTQFLQGRNINFYLDGAHTTESVESCVAWYREATKNSPKKRILIFNMTGDRDYVGAFGLLRSLNFSKVFFVPNASGETMDDVNGNLVDRRQQMTRCRRHREAWGEESIVETNVGRVIDRIIREDESSNDRPNVLITGSLHLVGAALAIIDPDLTISNKL